jgi:CRISPR-associated protein (TIGR03986 family)
MPKITGRVKNVTTDDKERPQVPATEFPVTDKALGLAVGNQFESRNKLIVKWGDDVPLVAGEKPDVDRNPYNFVPLGPAGPWLENTPHPNHAKEQEEQVTGWLDYTITLKTPLFVPEGFPIRSGSQTAQLRRFCRILPNSSYSKPHYAIPGSSLKGVIRSEVEAVTNSLFGATDRKRHGICHLYRRRAMHAAGIVEATSKDDWSIRVVELQYVDERDWSPDGYRGQFPYQRVARFRNQNRISRIKAVPNEGYQLRDEEYIEPWLRRPEHIITYSGSLLASKDKSKHYTHLLLFNTDQIIRLPKKVRETYLHKVLTHPHLVKHFESEGSKYPGLLKGKPSEEQIKQEIRKSLELNVEEPRDPNIVHLIFFTYEGDSATSFGKNINYLWPAKKSVYELAPDYFPKVDDAKDFQEVRSLNEPLSLAERMFGFSGKHTAYGREAEDCDSENHWPELTITEPVDSKSLGIRLRLAPLTGPPTLAKSRPLYLEPRGSDKLSASYDDPDAKLRGRKIHWHQNTGNTAFPIWKKHLYDPDWHSGDIDKQCPPPFCALTALPENSFNGRIAFRNLTRIELGALIYALEGTDENHCLKLGKAKPRGFGSVRFDITSISQIDISTRYKSLDENAGISDVTSCKNESAQEFLNWQSKNSGSEEIRKAHKALRSFPTQPDVRYYPINFASYGWLPDPRPDNTFGESTPSKPRLKAMTPAYSTKNP